MKCTAGYGWVGMLCIARYDGVKEGGMYVSLLL